MKSKRSKTPKKTVILEYAAIVLLIFIICQKTILSVKRLPTETAPQNLLHEKSGRLCLLNRMLYRFRQPDRWSLVCLSHPYNIHNTIYRRIAGMPGDKIGFSNGDIYINGTISQKPYQLQELLWIKAAEDTALRWKPFDKSWSLKDTTFRVRTRKNTYIRKDLPFVDGKISCTVRFKSKNGGVYVIYRYKGNRFTLFIPGESESRSSFIQLKEKIIEILPVRFKPNTDYRLEWSFWDQATMIRINDIPVYSKSILKVSSQNPTKKTAAYLGAIKTSVLFSDFQAYRDVFYRNAAPSAMKGRTYIVDKQEYFLLQDTDKSEDDDSRIWGAVRLSDMEGKVIAVLLPFRWL